MKLSREIQAIETNALAAIAADIGEQHRLAQTSAAKAIEHACRAGALLLRVKAELPHGGFLQWLEANVSFAPRTAQRYMNAAAPRPEHAKCDSLSYSMPMRAKSRPQARPPKPGTARATTLKKLHEFQRRDRLISHARYLASELPSAPDLTDEDKSALTQLRDRIDEALQEEPPQRRARR